MASNEPPPPYFEGTKVPPPPYAQEGHFGGAQGQPPPAGWGTMPPPPPPYQYGATSQTTTVTIQPGLHGNVITSRQTPVGPATQVIIVGNGCPNCRAGVLTDSYGFCAIFMALFFFPLGILCCLAMREKRCTNCGASF